MPAQNLQVRRKHDARTRPHALPSRPGGREDPKIGEKKEEEDRRGKGGVRGARRIDRVTTSNTSSFGKKQSYFLRHPRFKRHGSSSFFIHHVSCFIAHFLRPVPVAAPTRCSPFNSAIASVELVETRTILPRGEPNFIRGRNNQIGPRIISPCIFIETLERRHYSLIFI